MTYVLNDKHLESVLRLAAPERYEYVIKRVADWQAFYGLESSSGWAISEDSEGSQLFPIWPHSKFSDLCIKDDWKNCKSVKVSLSEWFEKIHDQLLSKQIKVAIFPIPEGKSVIVEPDRFSVDLKNELSKMEEEGDAGTS